MNFSLIEHVDSATTTISECTIPSTVSFDKNQQCKERDFHKRPALFIHNGTCRVREKSGEECLDQLRSGVTSIDSLVAQWTKAFQEGVKKYKPSTGRTHELDPPIGRSHELGLSDVYHHLIHSNTLETLLNLEYTYSLSVKDILEQRDLDTDHLTKRQSEQMEEALTKVDDLCTVDQINQLAQRNFENLQLIENKWASELKSLMETQKKEYRQWLRKVYEDSRNNPTPSTYIQRVRALTNSLPLPDQDVMTMAPLEESFTIHLGAQLKITHNLRLLRTDPLDLCRHKANTIGGTSVPSPQGLHTAMSLYSNHICGLVLLVNDRLNTDSGVKHEFAKVCEQSTDFHFPSINDQIASIQNDVLRANDWRQEQNMNDTTINPQDKSTRLYVGDVYVTKHSNLSEAHVVFHVVTDDSIQSHDLTSRDSVVLALRNVLKNCYRYDVYTLSMPLLLSHYMYEEMTVQWCLKRAELILKCMKGFMMEMSTWGDNESRTIQFVVPPGISEEMFSNISALITQIFRLSNPVIAKSS